MTNEQFSREYQLLDRLSQGAVVTHPAQSSAGAMVMVHFLRGTDEENAAAMRQVEEASPQRRDRIISVVDVDGVRTIVTKFIVDFTTLNDWLTTDPEPRAPTMVVPLPALAQSEPAASPPAPSASRDPAGEPRAPGALTQLFQRVSRPVDPPDDSRERSTAPSSVPPSAPPPAYSPAPQASSAPPSGPGEFTLMFHAIPRETAPEPASPFPASAPPPPSATAQPFSAAQASDLSQSAPPAMTPPETESGEFKRVFGDATPGVDASWPGGSFGASPADGSRPFDGAKSSPFDPPRPSNFNAPFAGFASPEVPPAQSSSGPGEYTKMFGNPGGVPAIPLPPFAQQSSQNSTPFDFGSSRGRPKSDTGDSYFGHLIGGVQPAPHAPAPIRNQAPAIPDFSGPSDFTRIVGGPPPLVAPPAPQRLPTAAIPSAPKAASGNDRLILFTLIGVIALAILLVALFLVAT